MLNRSLKTNALVWMVIETFRRARATRLFWLMLAGSALCIALCLSVGIEGTGTSRGPEDIELFGADGRPLTAAKAQPGQLTLAFGAFHVALFRDGPAMVHLIQVILAKWVAGAAGTLLALIWTAGFVPEFLQPAEVAVLLAKPVSRRRLLFGKVLGVLLFVAFHAVVFIGGTWLALGLRTGVWSAGYLWSIPLLCLNFAMIFGVSVALAVWTRNTAVCALGSIGFWLVCFAVNSGHDALGTLSETARGIATRQPVLTEIVEIAYWTLPKPMDLAVLLDNAIGAGNHVRSTTAFGTIADTQVLHPVLVLATSLLFGFLLVLAGGRQFERLDY